MALHKMNTLSDYLIMLRNDHSELAQLYGDILIRVTGFFRDPEVFDALKNEVFPEIIADHAGSGALRTISCSMSVPFAEACAMAAASASCSRRNPSEATRASSAALPAKWR